LNVSQIEGFDRFGLGYLFRMSEAVRAAGRLERALATNTFDGDLAEFQRDFLARSDADALRPAVRFVRAEYDLLFRAVSSGSVWLESQLHLLSTGQKQNLRQNWGTWRYRPQMNADWAAALDVATRALRVADLPEEQWLAAWGAVPRPPVDDQHPFSIGCT